MSKSAGKLQIVLKGGKPWGFRLKSYSENRSAVIVDYIEPDGKAQIHGGLKVGDHVIKINDVLCLSLDDANQLIDSAFRTLTVLIWRPSFFAQSNKSIFSNSEVQTQNCYIPTYSTSVNKLSESVLQQFHNFKGNTSLKQSDKHILNYNTSESDNSVSSLPYQLPDATNVSLQQFDQQKKSVLRSCSPVDSLNKSKSDFNSSNNQEYNNALLTQYHQSANLQYICEQYPLSELFLNYKSDLKLESLTSHSKRLFKTYQENGIKPFDSIKYKDTSLTNEPSLSKTSECVYCMYPKCHSSYKKCKVHSPPERDLAASQAKFIDKPVSSQLISYEEKYNSDLIISCKSSEDYSVKKLNGVLSKSSHKIKEDGFKNSDLKIFKPLESSASLQPVSYHEIRRQGKDDAFYQEQVSQLKSDQNKCSVSPKYYMPDIKEKSYSSGSKTLKIFSSEVMPEALKEQTIFINHSEQNKSTPFCQNVIKEAVFELCNQNSGSGTLSEKSFHRSYLKENERSVCLKSNNDCVGYSNGASIINVFCAEPYVSDGDEDEELCLIEENARNKYSCLTPHYSSLTLDLALPPPPPPVDDNTEIIATNEPLPSPPSFSPVKEVIYENIAINKKPDEAIYANLEMLKIKCSVVNSATQTNSLRKPSRSPPLDSKQLTKSFSFVETEILSNIIAPTLGNNFRSDYLRSFLQSQLEKYSSVFNESLYKPEDKYSFERYAVNLPLASAYFTTSEPKAKLLTRYISNLNDRNIIGGELNNKKEELVTSINKKLGILRLEQIALKEEMKQNDELGCSLSRKLEKIAQPNEVDKFRVHVEELEKITNLMISLSGRLARAENALLILPSDASSKEKNILEEKYSKLNKQYEEAKYLKKSIDRRNCHLSLFLRKYFTEEEFTDYDHFITMKTKLLMDFREIDEKIKLGEEQLDALKSSVNSQNFNKLMCDSGN